jgi:23S rRNA pseudouridine2605 synthase
VTVNGKPLKVEHRLVYLMFHKPKNVLTTMDDPEGRPTIADYFKRLPVRIFPVGRLDWDSEGMILLTNDGEFSQAVNHPKNSIPKTYLVKVNGHISGEQLNRLKAGVSIIGGRVSAIEAVRIKKGDSDLYDWVKIVIDEGKNRQIRLMMEKVGFDVIKLQRVAIGKLKLGSLERGEYVMLEADSIKKIFETFSAPSEVKQTVRKRKKQVSSKRLARDRETKTLTRG